MQGIALADLTRRSDGISLGTGTAMAEAGSVCLGYHDHHVPVILEVVGDDKYTVALDWSRPVNQVLNAWGDLEEPTEWGASGVAILLAVLKTGYKVLERACKGQGNDYWLGPTQEDRQIFRDKIRLEASGILDGSDKHIKDRVRKRIRRFQRYGVVLGALIVVVEFSRPRAAIRGTPL